MNDQEYTGGSTTASALEAKSHEWSEIYDALVYTGVGLVHEFMSYFENVCVVKGFCRVRYFERSWKIPLLLCFFLPGLCALGQIPYRDATLLNVADGLSNSSVYALYQDRLGYLWIGAGSGLDYYDGYTIRAHLPEIFRGLQVRQIIDDGADGLWIGCDQGLYRLGPDRSVVDQFELSSDPSQRTVIIKLVRDDEDRLWIATETGLFTARRGEKPEAAGARFGRPENRFRVHDVLPEASGVWLASAEGVIFSESGDGSLRRWGLAEGLPTLETRALVRDQGGLLWIATVAGLCVLDGDIQVYQASPDDPVSLPTNTINLMTMDEDGSLWLGLRQGGLAIWDPLTRQVTTGYSQSVDEGRIANDTVLAIYLGEPNLAWLGHFKGGLSMLDLKPMKFPAYRLDLDDSSQGHLVRGILTDDDGNLWIASLSNLLKQDPQSGEIRRFRFDPNNRRGIGFSTFLSLGLDGLGQVWVGSVERGVARYDPRQDRFFNYGGDRFDPKGLLSDRVVAFGQPEVDGFWLGTMGGLYRYLPDQDRFELEPLTSDETSTDTYIQSILQTSSGELWVATNLRIYRRTESGVQVFEFDHTNPVSPPRGPYRHMAEDRRGRVWIGGGLSVGVFQSEIDGFRVFGPDDGVTPSPVRSLVADPYGDVWVAVHNGLWHFEEQRLLRTYQSEDGLGQMTFFEKAAWADREGLLYFGGSTGYSVFDPKQITQSNYQPNVVLSSLQVLGEERPTSFRFTQQGRIVLSPHDRNVRFSLASLDLSAPHRNQFQYKLDGFEQEWSPAGEQHRLSYTNLPKGDYVLQVRATNADGVWSEQELRLELNVEGVWWNHWGLGALVLAGLLALALILHFYLIGGRHAQMSDLMTLAEQRGEVLEDLHQQLLEEARKRGMAEVSTGVLHNVGNILSTINTSANILIQGLHRSKDEKFGMANQLMADHRSELGHFLRENPKGEMLFSFYRRTFDKLFEENEARAKEITGMMDQLDLIDGAVAVETESEGETVRLNLNDLVEDALCLQEISLRKANVQVLRDIENVPEVYVNAFKLTHVLVNLIRNAADAMKEVEGRERILRIRVYQESEAFCEVEVRDNGCGIALDDLPKLFIYGFTTKAKGNGFGLHTCKMAMDEMGGAITAGSRGPGKGAVFKIKAPIAEVGER